MKFILVLMMLTNASFVCAANKKSVTKHKQQAGLYRDAARPGHEKYNTGEQ